MKPITIAIADDYQVYRDGLKVGLSADENLQVIAEAGNGQELLQQLETVTPDVIIMDLKMPVMDGMEATRQVRKRHPGIKVLVVTMYDGEQFITHVMETGANGYLLKNAEPEEIRKAIYAIHEHGYYFHNVVSLALLKKIVSENNLRPRFRPGIMLTSEEDSVLQLTADEKTDDLIAEQLKISVHEVQPIRNRLQEKIGVHNTAGLVLYALNRKKQ